MHWTAWYNTGSKQNAYVQVGNGEWGLGLQSLTQAGVSCHSESFQGVGTRRIRSSWWIQMKSQQRGGQNPSQQPLYNATMHFESQLPLWSSITFPLVAIYDCVYVACKDESSHVRFIIHRVLSERPIAVYESCSNVLSGTSSHRCVFWPMWWQHDMKMDLFCAVEVQGRGPSQPALV